MLKLLTHKLRTHSINEERPYQIEKTDADHDSGTESDEEAKPQEMQSPVFSDRMCSVSPADTGCSMESPAPDHHDPHSSEEELEVIYSNSSNTKKSETLSASSTPLRAASVCLPEKRKWSQVEEYQRYRPENEENMSHFSNLSPPSSCSPYLKSYDDDGHRIEHSGSSDDEVHAFLACRATPVKFRTSPPLEAVKPGKRAVIDNKVRSLSPPQKVFHFEVSSSRRRSRHVRGAHLQRPYLDFEKMQQVVTPSPIITAPHFTFPKSGSSNEAVAYENLPSTSRLEYAKSLPSICTAFSDLYASTKSLLNQTRSLEENIICVDPNVSDKGDNVPYFKKGSNPGSSINSTINQYFGPNIDSDMAYIEPCLNTMSNVPHFALHLNSIMNESNPCMHNKVSVSHTHLDDHEFCSKPALKGNPLIVSQIDQNMMNINEENDS